MQTVSAQLKENRAQLESAEKTYQELVRAREVSIRAAQDKIEALKFGLSDLKIKHATAELNEMAAGMIQKIGGSGDTLGRLSEMVEEDRQRAAGRARVARDSLDTSGFLMKEAEQKALADQALADFAAKEGLALEAHPPSTEATVTRRRSRQDHGTGKRVEITRVCPRRSSAFCRAAHLGRGNHLRCTKATRRANSFSVATSTTVFCSRSAVGTSRSAG